MTDQPDVPFTPDTAALTKALYKLVQQAIDGLTDGLAGRPEAAAEVASRVAALLLTVVNDPLVSQLARAHRTGPARDILDDAELLRTFVQETVGKDALDLDTTFQILRFAGCHDAVAPTESESGPRNTLVSQATELLQRYYTAKLAPPAPSPCGGRVHTPPPPFWNAPGPSIAAVPDVEIDSGVRMQVLTQLVELGLIDNETGRISPNLWKLVQELLEAQRAVDG